MKHPLVLSALFSLATALAPCSAQTPLVNASVRAVSVTAEVSRSIFSAMNSIPPGTDLSAGGSVSASISPNHFCSETIDPLIVGRQEIQFSSRAELQGPVAVMPTGVFGRAGGSSVIMTLTSPQPVRAELIVAETFGNVLGGAIDIGNDGSIEYEFNPITHFGVVFSNPRIESFPVAFTGSLDFAITTAIATGQSFLGCFPNACNEQVALTVRIVPDLNCTATPYGTAGCAPGLALSTAENLTRGVDLTLTGAASSLPAVAILGLTQTSLMVPVPPFCTLETSADVTAMFPAAAGAGTDRTLEIPLFATQLPLQFNAQAVVLDFSAGTALLTQPLALTCQ